MGKVAVEEKCATVKPELCRFIVAELLFEGSKTTRWGGLSCCKDRFHETNLAVPSTPLKSSSFGAFVASKGHDSTAQGLVRENPVPSLDWARADLSSP